MGFCLVTTWSSPRYVLNVEHTLQRLYNPLEHAESRPLRYWACNGIKTPEHVFGLTLLHLATIKRCQKTILLEAHILLLEVVWGHEAWGVLVAPISTRENDGFLWVYRQYMVPKKCYADDYVSCRCWKASCLRPFAYDLRCLGQSVARIDKPSLTHAMWHYFVVKTPSEDQ